MHDSRKHIIDVSTSLFLGKSYKEVTLQEIVAKTGLSKGAFYHYFKSKEHVFQEVAEHLLSSMIEGGLTRLNRNSLFAFYHDFIDHFADSLRMNDDGDSANMFTLIFDALKLFPDIRNKVIQVDQMTLHHWEEVIRKAKETEEIKSSMSNEQIARLFMYSADGIGLNQIFKISSIEETKSVLLALWDDLYRQLQH